MGIRRLDRFAATVFVLLAVGAGCKHEGPHGTGDGGAPSDAGVTLPDGGPECTSANQCASGVCSASGTCCASAAQLCNATCCATGSLCLFDECVVPGAPCRGNSDCGPNQYCEPALGTADGGTGSTTDAGCSSAILGRCVPLPPTCSPDGGTAPDGGTCIADCEYHPQATPMLDATTKWTWGASAAQYPDDIDVWSTPTVGRLTDSNCDGKVDSADTPNVVFVSGNTSTVNCNAKGNPDPRACQDGVLRVLDGSTGKEVWSLAKASSTSVGFMVGLSLALGDVDHDGFLDIVAMTGEGDVVVIDHTGNVKYTSDVGYAPAASDTGVGWGGGFAVADMDLDGWAEIAVGATVWTMKGGALKLAWTGTGGDANANGIEPISVISDVDLAPDGHLELVAGNTAYLADGTVLWKTASVGDGFPAVGDLDKDGTAEVVSVASGKLTVMSGATGAVLAGGAFTLPGTGSGGPPTIADFDGDHLPEIGVAMANYYSVVKPTIGAGGITGLTLLWQAGDHDFSSSVTGSTVFDFEGDGIAEVIYADECWLWVFNGQTGAARLAVSHSSFTATESSIVADIDGDGHAEMLIPSQGVNMNGTWDCIAYESGGTSLNGQYWTPGPQANSSYRGLVALGDAADSWVGTRSLWNEHSYHVTNICDGVDSACAAPNTYGAIPQGELPNLSLTWLDNFRQNVQDKGIFNAPDAVVSLVVGCTSPPSVSVSLRNIGQAGLPPGVNVGVFEASSGTQVGEVTSTLELLPGQTQTLDATLSSSSGPYYAKILIDPMHPTFHECNTQNDQSAPASSSCVQ